MIVFIGSNNVSRKRLQKIISKNVDFGPSPGLFQAALERPGRKHIAVMSLAGRENGEFCKKQAM
jgi:hypothetical protein